MQYNFGTMKNSEVCTLIDEYVRGKSAERNRAIMKRRMIDGVSYERIAEEFAMSTVQIKRIVYRLVPMLKPPDLVMI